MPAPFPSPKLVPSVKWRAGDWSPPRAGEAAGQCVGIELQGVPRPSALHPSCSWVSTQPGCGGRMLPGGGALVLYVAQNPQYPLAPCNTDDRAQLETAACVYCSPPLPSSPLPACAVPPTADSGARDCWDRYPPPPPPKLTQVYTHPSLAHVYGCMTAYGIVGACALGHLRARDSLPAHQIEAGEFSLCL